MQNGILSYLYINVLDLLSTMAQESYPYHVDKGDIPQRMYINLKRLNFTPF